MRAIKLLLPSDSEISVFGIYPKEIIQKKSNCFKMFIQWTNTICISEKLKRTQISSNKTVTKQPRLYRGKKLYKKCQM